MRTKPFDLEAAKAGAKVVTRDGRQVRIICFDKKDPQYPIVALVPETKDIKSLEVVFIYQEDGRYFSTREHDRDLFLLDEGEPELTAFEKAIYKFTEDGNGEYYDSDDLLEITKDFAPKLLELAKKELRLEVEAEYWGTQKPYFKGKEDGRAELLSNLPKWRKMKGACGCGDRVIAIIRTAPGYYYLAKSIGPGDTYIYLEDLEKLPWEE